MCATTDFDKWLHLIFKERIRKKNDEKNEADEGSDEQRDLYGQNANRFDSFHLPPFLLCTNRLYGWLLLCVNVSAVHRRSMFHLFTRRSRALLAHPAIFFFFAIHVFTIGFDKIRSIYAFFSLHHCAWLYDFCSFPIVFLHFFGLIVSIVLQNAFFLHIYLSGMTKRCDSNWKIFYINWWQWSIAEYGQQLHYWAQNAHTVLQIHIPKWMRETPDCEETNTPYHHYFNTITFFIKILLQSENYIQVSSFQLIIFTKINCEYFILPENFW